MKNLRNVMGSLWVAAAILFSSCEKDTTDTTLDPVSEIPSEVLAKLKEVKLNHNDVNVKMIEGPDGNSEEMYEIEGDILMSHQQLMDMSIEDGFYTKQYRTRNLVSATNIRVVGWNGNDRFGLNAAAQRGLRFAVDNYNRLNTRLNLQLVFSTSFNNNDILAYTQTNGSVIPQDGIRGRAGFPANGRAFNRIIINGGANRSSNDQILEGLFTHELGHCVGLRHTDWFSRQSCGENVRENTSNDGAIHIPGTPTGTDFNSIMQACFPGARNQGEFGVNDVIALEFLY